MESLVEYIQSEQWLMMLFIGLGSMLSSYLGCRFWIANKTVIDNPEARSSHYSPIPSAGGIIVMPIILVVWIVARMDDMDKREIALIIAACGLLAISYWDDKKSVRWVYRLAVQFLACAMSLPFILNQGSVFQELLPSTIEPTIILIGWIAFINFYNFMDGIDSMLSSQTTIIAAGFILIAALTSINLEYTAPLAAMVGVVIGFAFWNKHPAKLFIGDSGAIPLGFIIGGLLLSLAANGLWLAALILPLYFCADAGLTVLMRLIKGKVIWEAHDQHFFKQAQLKLKNHHHVMYPIWPTMLGLCALAILSIFHPIIAAGLSIALVLLLLAILIKIAKKT